RQPRTGSAFLGGLLMRPSALVGLAILACCATSRPVTAAQERPARTLAQDRQKLEGLWRTDGWRQDGADGWQCQTAVSLRGSESPRLSLTINFERGSKATSGPVLGSQVQLKERGDRRWLAIKPSKGAGLPEEIVYRFDGDALILRLEEGPCRGEYRL